MTRSLILRREFFGYLLYDINSYKTYVSYNQSRFEELKASDFKSLENNERLFMDVPLAMSLIRYIDNRKNNTLSAPNTVFWEITDMCNLRCKHCFNFNSRINRDELTHEEAIDLIDQLSDLGVFQLKITGGEPFMRRDLVDLLQHLDEKNVNYIIYTNGTQMSQELYRHLERLKCLMKVRVSLDGYKEGNDGIRGAGTYERAIRAVNDLSQQGIPCEINFTITPSNYTQLAYVAEHLNQERIATEINLGFAKYSGEAVRNQEICFFTKDSQIENVIHYIKESLSKYHNIIPFYELSPLYYEFFGSSFGCPAARLTETIKSDGSVFACGLFADYDNLKCGSIRKDKLQNIWASAEMEKFRNLQAPAKCQECRHYLKKCTGACRGNALNQFHNLCAEDSNCIFYTVDWNNSTQDFYG